MLEIPDILYHATSYKNLFSILKNGISPNYNGVYFTDDKGAAMSFVAIKSIATGRKEIASISVDTSILDKSLFVEGADHSPMFFENASVFVYPNIVPPEAINTDHIFKYNL